MTLALFKALYGRDDEYIENRYELWKETSGNGED